MKRTGVGDYVAEQCVADGPSGTTALRITLYRPAWMELATSED